MVFTMRRAILGLARAGRMGCVSRQPRWVEPGVEIARALASVRPGWCLPRSATGWKVSDAIAPAPYIPRRTASFLLPDPQSLVRSDRQQRKL